MRHALFVAFGALVACGLACGPGVRDNPVGADARPTVDAAGTIDAAASIDAVPVDNSRVYAHSAPTDTEPQKLWRVDTTTFVAVEVAPITMPAAAGDDSLQDIAVDQDDNIIGITFDKLFRIDRTTGNATLLRDLAGSAQGFSSLSFIPTDLGDPASPDRLVAANNDGEVYEIDQATGEASLLGVYGEAAAGTIGSSGDLFGVRGLGIYATVTIGTRHMNNDYLAVIDPVTWAATPLGVGAGFKKIFGLGFWGDKIYGFVDDGSALGTGSLVELDRNTGAATELEASPVRWYGAGVSTDAFVIE